MRRLAPIGLVVLVLGCGSGGAPASDPVAVTHAHAAEPSASPASPQGSAPPVASASPAALIVRITGRPTDGQVEIAVTNAGSANVSLSKHLRVETEVSPGTFAPLEGAALELRHSCASDSAECITLVPGATLLPPEWLGTVGDVQCVCTRCAKVPAGRYRFVGSTCAGARLEGAAFQIAPVE